MYKKILVPLENSKTDTIILAHIRKLAKMTSAEFVLVHVADGYVARLQEQLNLEDSEEIQSDRAYLESVKNDLIKEGFLVKTYLPSGEPSVKILEIAQQEKCDLIAMSTHGHRFLKDFIFGSVADDIRHKTDIPILMIKAHKDEKGK